jgi:hypothetical protein
VGWFAWCVHAQHSMQDGVHCIDWQERNSTIRDLGHSPTYLTHPGPDKRATDGRRQSLLWDVSYCAREMRSGACNADFDLRDDAMRCGPRESWDEITLGRAQTGQRGTGGGEM